MKSCETPVRTALVLDADKLYAEMLRQYILRASPGAQVSSVATVRAAQRSLEIAPVELLVTSIDTSLDGDVLDILTRRAGHLPCSSRVLVVTGCREYRMLAALRTLGVEGVFDTSSEQPEQLIEAIRSVSQGLHYWSTTVLDFIRQGGEGSQLLLRLLTQFEQMVLAVIGDGSDDLTASCELGLSPATVCTVRRELHRKLRVQHRGALVRAAAQYGFVRFTPFGVVRPGFQLLVATYRPRKRKAHNNLSKEKTQPFFQKAGS